MFSGSVPFTLCVLTPPPIRHPDTDLDRSLHPISYPRPGLGPPVQTTFHLFGFHRLSFTCCLVALYLLPRSLSAPAAPRHKPVSAVSSPVLSPPFADLDISSALVNPCGFSRLGHVFPPQVLERRVKK